MLKTKKYYRDKAKFLEFLDRGLSGWDTTLLGITRKYELQELNKLFRKKLFWSDLQIVEEKDAKMTCVLYAAYPDSDGYDILGCSCFIGKVPENPTITYCGMCGDVNTFHITKYNSIKLYVR